MGMREISLNNIKSNIKFLLQNDLKQKMTDELNYLRQELLLHKIVNNGDAEWTQKHIASIKYLQSFNSAISITNEQILQVKKSLLFNEIINNENQQFKEKYKTEICTLKKNGSLTVFPYKQIRHIKNVSSQYDSVKKMPFVIHDRKRLYFPGSYSLEKASSLYNYYVQTENILGGGYTDRAPHQYESKNYSFKQGDTLIDIGCAEALFSLHHIDKIKKAYLIESDPIWADALKATFEPYAAKVYIINKLISDENSEISVTIDSILENENFDSLFIKMDIEGNEKHIVKSCLDFFENHKQGSIKMCCCTYHLQQDAEELKSLFISRNFSTEFSEGYMLFYYDDLKYPYFRKGIIRARN